MSGTIIGTPLGDIEFQFNDDFVYVRGDGVYADGEKIYDCTGKENDLWPEVKITNQ